MYFANPWGLLGLLALPAILAIHFFHRRYPPLVIAGAHLWGIETEVQTIGRRWDRLPLSWSLLFELLAALMLALMLSQPRLGTMGTAVHLVVVLDHSASMQARPPNGLSFRDRAVEELKKRAEEFPQGSRFTLILSGPLPETLAGPAVTWPEAEAKLANWKPSLPGHNFQPAWDRAVQFAGSSGKMLFLTDHLPAKEDPIPEAMQVSAFGEALRNVAITTGEWTLDPSTNTSKLYVRIANNNPLETQVEIKVLAGEKEILSRRPTVPAGEEFPLEEIIPLAPGPLTVEVFSPADGLELDNRITLLEPKPRPVKVSVELPQDSAAWEAVQKGLKVIPGLKMVSADEADLQIATANPLPVSNPDLWWLGIGPIDRSEQARQAAKDVEGPYILDYRHPLVRDVQPGTLIWGGVQIMPSRVARLLSCGNDTLLGQLEGTFTTGFLLNIEFSRSQLQQSLDWPILLSNLIELRRENLRGLNRWNYRQNETVRFRAPQFPRMETSPLELMLSDPKSNRPLVRGLNDFVEIHSIHQAGIYELRLGETTLDRIAVNYFDAEESNLSTLHSGQTQPETAETELFRLDNPYSWLILLGLAIVLGLALANWKTLRV